MSSYQDTLDYLYGLQRFGIKLGLGNIRALLRLLGNPERDLRFIHIAGTNGKGSVAAMLSSIFRAAGYRTGLYTSPHLVSFSERIQLNGLPLTEADVLRLVEKLRPLAERVSRERDGTPLTFFEFVTAMAAESFRSQDAEIVIWETGLGGRLDATNAVTPLVSVITNVAHDHTETLGDSLESIAKEKCGIIKSGVPVVTAADSAAVLAVIRERCRSVSAPLTEIRGRAEVIPPSGTKASNQIMTQQISEADRGGQSFRLTATRQDYGVLELPLTGYHQTLNAAVAIAAVEQCFDEPASHGKAFRLTITPERVREGLASTQWPGRCQFFEATSSRPALLLDGAHNTAAVQALRTSLEEHFANRPLIFVLGILRDKDYVSICQTLAPLAREIFTVTVKNPRTASSAELAQVCSRETLSRPSSIAANKIRGYNITDAVNLPRALELAQNAARTLPQALVVVTGSFFLVGETLAHLKIPVFGKVAQQEFAATAQ